jgi:uncharacterized OB-fold protein
MSAVELARTGTLWSFTVVRFRPPGEYRGPDPFEPMPCGMVELEDGLRVLAPLRVDLADLQIGMRMEFCAAPGHLDDEGREVVTFSFIADAGGRR